MAGVALKNLGPVNVGPVGISSPIVGGLARLRPDPTILHSLHHSAAPPAGGWDFARRCLFHALLARANSAALSLST